MYVKLFGSILESSIWEEDHATVRVWIALLAMADKDGIVLGSDPGLARRANVSREEFTAARDTLESPDTEREPQEFEGRRIERVEKGYLLLNYAKYREIQTEDQLKNAARQRSYYHKKQLKERQTSRTSRPYTDTEATTDTEVKNIKAHPTEKTDPALISPNELIDLVDGYHRYHEEQFERLWEAKPKRAAGNPKKLARIAFLARIKDGVDSEEMIAGMERYRIYCEAEGQIGTRFVKEVRFWLSPNYEGWAQPWEAPAEAMSEMSIDVSKVQM